MIPPFDLLICRFPSIGLAKTYFLMNVSNVSRLLYVPSLFPPPSRGGGGDAELCLLLLELLLDGVEHRPAAVFGDAVDALPLLIAAGSEHNMI